jgi:hypothetical protein
MESDGWLGVGMICPAFARLEGLESCVRKSFDKRGNTRIKRWVIDLLLRHKRSSWVVWAMDEWEGRTR